MLVVVPLLLWPVLGGLIVLLRGAPNLGEGLESRRRFTPLGGNGFLDAPSVSLSVDDAALAAWLELHPRVIERPIVVDESEGRAVIGRPPENVRELIGP